MKKEKESDALEYRDYIKEMVDKIADIELLKRIYYFTQGIWRRS